MIDRNLCVQELQGLISSSYPHPEDIYTAHCTNIAQLLKEIYTSVNQALNKPVAYFNSVHSCTLCLPQIGATCVSTPHTLNTLNHSRHTYCNTNVSVSDFCKLIFQILKCVLSVCTRTLETQPRTSFIEAYDIRSLKLSEIMSQKFLTYWSKIGCETLQSLYGIFCSS